MRALWVAAGAFLIAALPATAQEGGSTLTGVQVVQLAQSALALLGAEPGPVDGVIGPRTRAAITTYVEASGLEMGWNGQTVDQGQAMSLNVAASRAIADLLGFEPDGNYVPISVVPGNQTEDLIAGRIAFLSDHGEVTCANRPDEVARLNGLMFFEPGQEATVITWDDGAFAALPRNGAWHPEAEPWRLVALSADTIALQAEGDNYVYARCIPSGTTGAK